MRHSAHPGKLDGQKASSDEPDAFVDGGTHIQNDRGAAVDASPGSDVKDVRIDPVTRVGGSGALVLDATVDFDEGEVLEASVSADLFHGYEPVLEGRDSRDAVDLSSRICGFEGAAHSIASSMALEMAYPVEPPALGVWVRNMGQAAGFLLDLAGHLFLLAGPDYSATVLRERNPALFDTAQSTAAPHADIHGYETIGDIMTALNPMTGDLYLEVLRKAREVLELSSLMVGKYPHPSTAAPGGITTTISGTTFTQFYTRLKGLADYAKTVPPLWDDLLDFLLWELDGFEEVGAAPANLLSTGAWDDPAVYNARYEDADEWGRARFATPGAVVDGDLETTALTDVDAGIEEFVAASHYEDWDDGDQAFESTPAGDSIGAHHPWNKDTRPDAAGDDEEPYSWATAPRWNRKPMETGPHARMWITARAEALDNPQIRPTGDALELTVPEVARPEMTFRWEVPDRLNAAERLRATAYHVPYAGLVCYVGLLEAIDETKRTDPAVHNAFSVPSGTHRGVGFWETGRGSLSHYAVVDDGSLDTYQVLAPSTWTASPVDPFGTHGPMERAVANTPLLESATDAEEFTGLDLLRAVRSFDPCVVCAAH